MSGRSVRLFLVDGSPTGILTGEIMNWTGHVLVTPRSKMPEALKRPEAARTGIYFLTGDDPDHPGKLRVYTGEGDSVLDRIKAHAKDASKDFWTHACIVTSKDANLTKSHVRYLESRFVEIAKAADRAKIANGNDPSAKQLPESDIADMEFFLTQVQVVLPVVGFDFLRPKLKLNVPQTSIPFPVASADQVQLILNSKKYGVSADAIESDDEFVILAGSHALAKSDFTSNTYALLRKGLIDDGTLVLSEDGSHYIFTTDASLASPSAAAAVVLNRNSNGRTEWRVKSSGQTLKDWQDKLLNTAGS